MGKWVHPSEPVEVEAQDDECVEIRNTDTGNEILVTAEAGRAIAAAIVFACDTAEVMQRERNLVEEIAGLRAKVEEVPR